LPKSYPAFEASRPLPVGQESLGSIRARTPPDFRDHPSGGCPRNAPEKALEPRTWPPASRPRPRCRSGAASPRPGRARAGNRPKGGAQMATKPPLQRQPRADQEPGGQSRRSIRINERPVRRARRRGRSKAGCGKRDSQMVCRVSGCNVNKNFLFSLIICYYITNLNTGGGHDAEESQAPKARKHHP